MDILTSGEKVIKINPAYKCWKPLMVMLLIFSGVAFLYGGLPYVLGASADTSSDDPTGVTCCDLCCGGIFALILGIFALILAPIFLTILIVLVILAIVVAFAGLIGWAFYKLIKKI